MARAARLARERAAGEQNPAPVQRRRPVLTRKTAGAAPTRAAPEPELTRRPQLGKKSAPQSSRKELVVLSDGEEETRRRTSKHKKHKRSRSRSGSSSSSSSSEDERRRKHKKSKKSKKKSKKSRRRSSSRDGDEESSDDEMDAVLVTFQDPARVAWDSKRGELAMEDDGVSNVMMEARHKLRTPNSCPSLWWKRPFASEKATPVRGAGMYLEAAMGVARVNELTLKRLHFRSNAVTVKMLLTRNADVSLKDSKV